MKKVLIYNNLVINLNSKRYKPFLLNLVSGRRHFLNDSEVEIIREIACKSEYDEKAEELINRLIQEKQFITDETLKEVERSMEESGYWAKETDIADVPYIRITGGEPLVNEESASMIRYIANKWKKAKIVLFTNGINLIRYYSYLPIDRLEEVVISLDGIAEVHLKHRYSEEVPTLDLFDDIICGIKQLLNDNVKVRITTILDKSNYKYYGELRKYLIDQNILNNPNCSHIVNTELNFRDEPDMDSIREVEGINSELSEYGIELMANQSMMKLRNIALRGYNEPYLPRCKRCRRERLANYFFACDGKVYHCDCLEDNMGAVGVFFPAPELFEDVVKQISETTILKQDKCRKCPYKYVCLGGCALVARAKGKFMDCGIFAHGDILDNLEFDYRKIAHTGEDNNAAY